MEEDKMKNRSGESRRNKVITELSDETNQPRGEHKYEKLARGNRKPLYRDPKLLLVLLLIGVICLLVFMESEGEDKDSNPQKEMRKTIKTVK